MLKAAGQLISLYIHSCNWKKLEKFAPTMDRLNQQAIKRDLEPGEILSSNIARIDNPSINLELAKAHSRKIKNNIAPGISFSFDTRRKRKEKLTIGYVCNNFNNHPTAHLICGLFNNHDKDKFNIIAYSYSAHDEYYYPMIKSRCSKIVNINIMNDAQAAHEIYADNVDILIDLKGHTPEARLEFLPTALLLYK